MKTEWTYAGAKATLALRVKFILTEEGERARDKAIMRYLLAMSEQFEGRPFSINPVALCDLWAEAWFEGRGSATQERNAQEAAQTEPASPVPTGDSGQNG